MLSWQAPSRISEYGIVGILAVVAGGEVREYTKPFSATRYCSQNIHALCAVSCLLDNVRPTQDLANAHKFQWRLVFADISKTSISSQFVYGLLAIGNSHTLITMPLQSWGAKKRFVRSMEKTQLFLLVNYPGFGNYRHCKMCLCGAAHV